MPYRFLADATLVLHLAFVLFVVAGGVIVLNRPRLAWLHIPAVIWGAWIEFSDQVCPLTHLENHLRALGADPASGSSLLERFVAPLVYPQLLFPGTTFPREGFILIGVLVVVINGWIYLGLWRRRPGANRGAAAGISPDPET